MTTPADTTKPYDEPDDDEPSIRFDIGALRWFTRCVVYGALAAVTSMTLATLLADLHPAVYYTIMVLSCYTLAEVIVSSLPRCRGMCLLELGMIINSLFLKAIATRDVSEDEHTKLSFFTAPFVRSAQRIGFLGVVAGLAVIYFADTSIFFKSLGIGLSAVSLLDLGLTMLRTPTCLLLLFIRANISVVRRVAAFSMFLSRIRPAR